MENEEKQTAETAEEQVQEKSSKIDKAFKEAISKLTAVMGGESNVPKKRTKVANDRVSVLVDEILKERAEAEEKNFKVKANALLESVIKFHQECEAAEALYKKTVEEKKQALTKEANDCWKMIENVEKLRQGYLKSLEAVGGGDK